jgi:hypothetical protein
MHFFYVDESGDTGANLDDANQPILVLGGISVRDEGWNATQQALGQLLSQHIPGALPTNFELHAKDLLSPNGEGIFGGLSREDRYALCIALLKLLADRSHGVHYFAIHKQRLKTAPLSINLGYDHHQPYVLAFDYLITYVNWLVKERLGQSARGMIILDKKDQYHSEIERLMHVRRFGGVAAHRIKWIVEFSYSVDSKKNPMVQLSDLVIYCLKRFIEIESGYRPGWPEDAKTFYARCYSAIQHRVARSAIVEREGRSMDQLNSFLTAIRAEPRARWRRSYDLGSEAG